jgi:hypothetical protein
MPAMTSVLRTFFFLMLAIFLCTQISCKAKNNTSSIAGLETADSATVKSYAILRRACLEKIIREMSVYPSVDCAAVVIGGVRTEQYQRFLWLKKIATDQELVQLTNVENGNVKAYAFWALTDRNYANCKALFEQHLKDTTSFEYLLGCMRSGKFIKTTIY